MYSEILKLVEGGITNDRQKVLNYSKKLGDYFINHGEEKIGEKILNIISKNNTNLSALDNLSTKPFDKESKVEMVDISVPLESSETLVFNPIVEKEIEDFIFSYLKRDKLIKAGIETSNHLLLYGPPGTGKTSLARFVSFQTGLPLITVRLDGMVSSLLGNTAKNIRKVFEYASKKPCILFLDEFDVLAKIRDDKNELGELKRIVNSLIQNIDSFSDDSILVAATNHAHLLDEAIWRRFDKIIKLDLPNTELRKELIIEYSNVLNNNYKNDSKKISHLSLATEGYSPADIKNVISSAAKKALIHDEEVITYSQVLYEIYLRENRNEDSINGPIMYLISHKVPQKEIAQVLNVSLRKVRNISKGDV